MADEMKVTVEVLDLCKFVQEVLVGISLRIVRRSHDQIENRVEMEECGTELSSSCLEWEGLAAEEVCEVGVHDES